MNTMEHDYSIYAQTLARRSLPLSVAFTICVLLLSACPTFEDDYSGTYVEVRDNALSEEVVVVDFFRFGFYSNAIVRTYRAPQSATPEDLLSQPISCAWTNTGSAPDDGGAWSLEVEGAQVRGLFGQDDSLELELEQEDASGAFITSTRTLRRFRDEPNNVCDVIRPVPLVASFNLRDTALNAMPQERNYTMRQPLFAMIWAGVTEKKLANGSIVFAATNDLTSEIYLAEETYVDRPNNALTGSLSFSMSPPPERALARSGDTRYALSHFVVIDDTCETSDCTTSPDTSFDWSIEEEPIIASSIQAGNEPDSPFPDATGLGKALLFVEGSLGELAPNFRNLIARVDDYIGVRDNAHFYVVDIFFDEDLKIIGMRLPIDPLAVLSYRTAKLRVSDDFVGNTRIQLPRLSPSAL